MEVTEEIMSEVRTACQFTKTRDDENQKKDHNFGFWVKKKNTSPFGLVEMRTIKLVLRLRGNEKRRDHN